MKYKSLKILLPYLEEYEQHKGAEHKELDINDFSRWLSRKTDVESSQFLEKEKPKATNQAMSPQGHKQAQISQLLNLMYKYLKFYIKKGLSHTAVSNPDDFGFLATLFMEGKMQKHVLIEKNTMEFSSGVEVIRRLERHKLIKSEADPQDKRAHLVTLTELGRNTFFQVLPTVQQIGGIAIAELSEKEQDLLLGLLHKLNDFHNPIFFDAKDLSVEQIVEHYVASKCEAC